MYCPHLYFMKTGHELNCSVFILHKCIRNLLSHIFRVYDIDIYSPESSFIHLFNHNLLYREYQVSVF